MPINEIILGVALVLGFSLIYSLLDRKYKAFRMGPLYREVFWQNFLVNVAVVGAVYLLLLYLVG